MKKLILLLFPLALFSQVGINTSSPTETLDVNGTVRIRNLPTVSTADSILVTQNGIIKKVSISNLFALKCPKMSEKSNPHYLLFYSDSSIPNPNNSISVMDLEFVSAGTWIENNLYYFSYSNKSGKPLVLKEFLVNFSGVNCVYKN